MENFCALFLGIAVVPQVVLWFTSRWLDGLEKWDQLPDDRKAEIWFGGSVLLGLLMGWGASGLHCAGWPGWLNWLYGVLNTGFAFLVNKNQHRKRQYGP